MNEPTMKATGATLGYPKVTQESIADKIADIRYLRDGTLTVCIIEMKNGFKSVGISAPAHAGNFNEEDGQTFAYEDAFRRLWPLEAYLLKEVLVGTADLPSSRDADPRFMKLAAKTAHEANRAYCLTLGDTSHLPWDETPVNLKESALDGVRYLVLNPAATPRDSHTNWMQFKVQDGWKYGEVKDFDAKTHPCLRPYGDLPPEQQMKDALFQATVRSVLGL